MYLGSSFSLLRLFVEDIFLDTSLLILCVVYTYLCLRTDRLRYTVLYTGHTSKNLLYLQKAKKNMLL